MAKILVVDDAKVMREMVAAVLSDKGHEITKAGDGTEALELVRNGLLVDLVLSDINMPQMNGISLVASLRRIDAYADIPVIMLTTESSDFKKNKAKSMGANGWLQKPIEPIRLLKAVNTMLARAGHIVPAAD